MSDTSASPLQIDPDITRRFVSVARESTHQIGSAIQAGVPLVDAWVGLLRAAVALPAAAVSSAGRSISRVVPSSGCCEIPETECPPYFVCDIAWEGTRGEQLKATIGLTNTRKVPQNFTLAATSFTGPDGDTGDAVILSPAVVELNAGESATMTVGFAVPATFAAGEAYDAQVRITGLYEQGVRVTLRVRAAAVPHCTIRQGEIPTRIHAHRWYQHFQCEEPCYQPAGGVTVVSDPNTPLRPVKR